MKNAKQNEIRNLALFRGCSTADIQWIARVADTVDIPAGRTIVRRGSTAREFVVLVAGEASASNGDSSVSFAPGAYFGHDALTDGGRHASTIDTRTPARLLVFSPGAFRGMLHRMPAVGRKLLAHVVAELRTADRRSRIFRAVS